MTILGPILMVGIIIGPILLSMQNSRKQNIELIDDSRIITKYDTVQNRVVSLIHDNELVHIDCPPITEKEARENFFNTSYDAILWVNKNVLEGGERGITIYYKKQLNTASLDYLKGQLNEIIYNWIMISNKVSVNAITTAKAKADVMLLTKQVDEKGKEKSVNTGLYQGIGWLFAILIYFFIFMYGVQVMRGVTEEKTSRIVEVILSSVKPFQLMMGKIIGVALVGLTQFLLWLVLTTSFYAVASVTLLKDIDMKQIQQKEEVIKIGSELNLKQMHKNPVPDEMTKAWNEFKTVDLTEIILCFLFYFLAGYFMYSALFAAIGSAVDGETDTQQFMLPITVPLIFAFGIAQSVMSDPQGSMAFWFSVIPLTSPVVMMVRLPFGVPMWEVLLSMSLLVVSFFITTWIAGRIYRTGILLYGKKVTWRELGKWLFYKG